MSLQVKKRKREGKQTKDQSNVVGTPSWNASWNMCSWFSCNSPILCWLAIPRLFTANWLCIKLWCCSIRNAFRRSVKLILNVAPLWVATTGDWRQYLKLCFPLHRRPHQSRRNPGSMRSPIHISDPGCHVHNRTMWRRNRRSCSALWVSFFVFIKLHIS